MAIAGMQNVYQRYFFKNKLNLFGTIESYKYQFRYKIQKFRSDLNGIWAKRYSLVYRAGSAVFTHLRKSLLRRFCMACLLDVAQFP